MVVILKTGEKITIPLLIAYDNGIWFYSFGGDETYIDDLGVEFYWSGRRKITEILSIQQGVDTLFPLSTLAELYIQDKSYYFDEVNQRLYVKWSDSESDWSIDRDYVRLQILKEGFSNRLDATAKGYYDDLFYKPIINTLSNFSQSANIKDFSLISLNKASLKLDNANGEFDDLTDSELIGTAIVISAVESGVDTTIGSKDLFTGFTYGGKIGELDREIEINDYRILYDKTVCPNVFELSEYADIDESIIGQRKPIAFGEIRRGIMIPLNSEGVEKGDASAIEYLLADKEIGAIRSVSAVYDDNDNPVSFTTDLANNKITFNKPALSSDAESMDLKKFKWSGQGYEIGGVYDNGLEIMKYALLKIVGLSFIDSLFDTIKWQQQGAMHPQSIGISLQSDRGIISELIEPVSASLRGEMVILGDSRITFLSTDIDKFISLTVERSDKTDETVIEVDASNIGSTVTVEYSTDFTTGEAITETASVDREDVVINYGIDRSALISPIKTVLADRADAITLGEQEAEFAKSPIKSVSVNLPLTTDTDINLFDLMKVDIGRFGNPNYRIFEVNDKDPDYMKNRIRLSGRYVADREYQEIGRDYIALPITLNFTAIGGSKND